MEESKIGEENTKQKNSYVLGVILLTISVVAIVAVIYQEYKLFLILEGPLALLPVGVIVVAILTTVYIGMNYADAFREERLLN